MRTAQVSTNPDELLTQDEEIQEVSAEVKGIEILDGVTPISGSKVIVNKSKRVYFKKDELVDASGNTFSDEKIARIKTAVKAKQAAIKAGNVIGVVVGVDGNSLTIFLDKEEPEFAIPMLFSEERRFIQANIEDVGVIKTDNDAMADAFNSFMIEGKTTNLNKISDDYYSSMSRVNDIKRDIKELLDRISSKKSEEERTLLTIEQLKEDFRKMISQDRDIHEYDNYYKSILKNPNIESVEVVEYRGSKALLATTKVLTYSNPKKHFKDGAVYSFPIGGYKILIEKDGSVKAANYTHHYSRGSVHHPCVNSSFSICMGGDVQRAVQTAIRANDYASAIHFLIDFLKEPNYGNPYTQDTACCCLQPITKKITKWEEYFNGSTYSSLNWNADKYRKDKTELLKKLSKRDGGIEDEEDDEDEEYESIDF